VSSFLTAHQHIKGYFVPGLIDQLMMKVINVLADLSRCWAVWLSDVLRVWLFHDAGG